MLNVHVDDGLWAGSGTAYEKARDKLRPIIHIGDEKRGSFEFLGRRVVQDEDFTFRVDQHEDVMNIEQIYILAVRRRTPSDSLTPVETSQ